MLRIWGRTTSSNVTKLLWLMDELGLDYERLDAGGEFGRTNTPEYRAMNPTGLVPTLDDGGFILWESNAILRYICRAHAPDTHLWPAADVQLCASIDRWMDYQQTTMNPLMAAVFRPLIRLPEAERDHAQIARDAAAFARGWDLVEPVLARQEFLAGSVLSLADIPLGTLAHRYFALPIDRPEQPALRAWYDRLCARPAYARHVALPLA